VRAVSESGPGSPGRKAHLKRVKNKVVCVFLLDMCSFLTLTPQVSTC
jgi:hypothetical protein